MSAITEIPAKTPRPMGRTDSFFPGMVKPVSEVSAAAAVPLVDPTVGEGEAVFAASAEADELVDSGCDVEELGAGVSVGFIELEGWLTVVTGYGKVSRTMKSSKLFIR